MTREEKINLKSVGICLHELVLIEHVLWWKSEEKVTSGGGEYQTNLMEICGTLSSEILGNKAICHAILSLFCL